MLWAGRWCVSSRTTLPAGSATAHPTLLGQARLCTHTWSQASTRFMPKLKKHIFTNRSLCSSKYHWVVRVFFLWQEAQPFFCFKQSLLLKTTTTNPQNIFAPFEVALRAQCHLPLLYHSYRRLPFMSRPYDKPLPLMLEQKAHPSDQMSCLRLTLLSLCVCELFPVYIPYQHRFL